jgi:uncharacterized protein YcgL (UPF0745 family)
LTWLDLPHIPTYTLLHLKGHDILQSSAASLATSFGLGVFFYTLTLCNFRPSIFSVDQEHVKELERQLFWLKHENLGVFEDLSNVPNELICPITQEIFREPVICAGKELEN